jgi:hypothetical protein
VGAVKLTHNTYVLIGDALAEIHAALPPGLERTERQPAEPPAMVEIWFAV